MNLTIIKFRKIKTKTEQIESLFGLGFSKVSNRKKASVVFLL